MQSTLGGRGYDGIDAFMADPEMELAIIATRSLDHVRHATLALAAGKTVLVEKPIGVTAEDYKTLRRLVKRYPGKLFFGHNHRFEPAFENARAIVAKGLIGDLRIVKLRKHHDFMRRNDWQMRLDCGGGQLSVWGPHLIDQGLRLLGAPVRNVQSHLRRILTPGDADDHVFITLTGTNDRIVIIEISNAMALSEPYCVLYGDRGALSYGQDQKTIRLKYLDPQFHWSDAVATADTPASSQGMAVDRSLPWIEEERPVEPSTNMWDLVETEMARHLYGALRQGIPFPITSDDALEVMRITETVKKQNPAFKWIG